jgi:hypothetical protein
MAALVTLACRANPAPCHNHCHQEVVFQSPFRRQFFMLPKGFVHR